MPTWRPKRSNPRTNDCQSPPARAAWIEIMLQKTENYLHALAQLKEAVAAYQAAPQDALYRDGLIQRFEFTVELARRSVEEYLEGEGALLSGIGSPRAVLKEAFAAGVITDEATWNAILAARNATSHVYDEKTAVSIAAQICADFLPVFSALEKFYK